MGPLCHMGLTSSVLALAEISGKNLTTYEITATIVAGILIDADKIFEIYQYRIKKQTFDPTARCRILHSCLAFPFGILLSQLTLSILPLLALFSHIAADALIPVIKYKNRHYSSHPPLVWFVLPFFKNWRYQFVTKGWPITQPAQFNIVYKLGEIMGLVLLISSLAALV